MSNQPNSKDTDCRKDLEQVRHIEGFPIGEPEDIYALSDPPHYTAYPNPHLADFVAKHGTLYDEATDEYQREPYVEDVQEGKYDWIYQAHSYHTKVPYKAITPFIEHYTEEGDLVFDGFCGTGMTGVAAQSLKRKAILCDLSPAASFIAYNYNTPIDEKHFKREAKQILKDAEREIGWMYETWHPHCNHPNRKKARINYTVWSDIFICPYCEAEIVFWDAAVEDGSVQRNFSCPACNAEVTKRDLGRATETVWDEALEGEIERARRRPAFINYSLPGSKKRLEKPVDEVDLALLDKIEERAIPFWYPTTRIDRDLDLWYERDYRSLGIYAIHHLYSKRNLWMTAFLWDRVRRVSDRRLRHHLLFWLQSVTSGFSLLNRYLKNAYSQVNRILSGTLYVGSTISEVSPWYALDGKIARIVRAPSLSHPDFARVTTQSATDINLPDNSIDYIFTDPPFGSNIIYSDLSIVWESWLRVFTSVEDEAVVHRRKHEGHTLDDYRQMMAEAFSQMFRILKPGRWITVEFHNTRAAVWTAIQDSLARAGFVVVQVAVLDKGSGTFKQVTAPGAVENDLIINAYKPRQVFQEQFLQNAGLGQERAFIAEFLGMLPPTADVNRSEKMLYSKMLAYYVQHGYEISMDSTEFYRMLNQEFVERDGYWFGDEAQAQAYEQRKLAPGRKKAAEQAQNVLFISDERSAITWLHHFLADGPRSLTDITTAYFKAPRSVGEDEIPELQQLLEETCVRVNGDWKRPDRLTAEELEARRQERLLRQFDDYLRQARSGQKLTDVRKEAVLAGFTRAYRARQFKDILTVGNKLEQDLVEASAELYDFIDIAETKIEV